MTTAKLRFGVAGEVRGITPKTSSVSDAARYSIQDVNSQRGWPHQRERQRYDENDGDDGDDEARNREELWSRCL
jgi:hypothetical protein